MSVPDTELRPQVGAGRGDPREPQQERAPSSTTFQPHVETARGNSPELQRERAASPTAFQPHVEAEEGDPTRGDYLIGALVALVVVVGLLWAFGIINLPVL